VQKGVITIQLAKNRCATIKKNSQNLINIYVLPFKNMEIMASYCFFIHMDVKEFKPKIRLMKI
jgi:hypothetical protein